MEPLIHGSLFTGIGGFDLGFEKAGIKTVWQVEIDPFCRSVLEKHWPDVQKFNDIRGCGRHNLSSVDILSGGFPCQDISAASPTKAGINGERSGLWREMYRIICELRPWIAIMENVSVLLVRGIERVLGDLATCGYDAEWLCLPASIFGAPHDRDRIFIIAYPQSSGLSGCFSQASLCGVPREASTEFGNRDIISGGWWGENCTNLRMGDGIPLRLARHYARAYGNAVVPQIAEWIGRRIVQANSAKLLTYKEPTCPSNSSTHS